MGIVDAAVYIEQNSHPRLWRLLAESVRRTRSHTYTHKLSHAHQGLSIPPTDLNDAHTHTCVSLLTPLPPLHTPQSLRKLDLDIAEKSFIRSEDYPGVEFVKRLRRLDDEGKQRAEVAAYFRVRILYPRGWKEKCLYSLLGVTARTSPFADMPRITPLPINEKVTEFTFLPPRARDIE